MQHLIIKYISGEITPEERKQMFLQAECDAQYREDVIAAINLLSLSDWLLYKDDIPSSIVKLMHFKEEHSKKTKTIRIWHWISYVAAVCVAILFMWGLMNRFYHASVSQDNAVAYQEFSTPPGQRAQVKLYDGTTVWLNARTVLRYPNRFEANERRVELDGEAYFDVAKDEKHPFVVLTEKANVKVLGTKFNVFAYRGQDEFSASLVEGAVEVYDIHDVSETMRIQANEQIVQTKGHFVKRHIGNADFLLWKEGIYAFDDAMFGNIVKKLELYYDMDICIQNSTVGAYRFSGKFRQRDGVENILRALQKVHPFSYTKDDKRNRITIG